MYYFSDFCRQYGHQPTAESCCFIHLEMGYRWGWVQIKEAQNNTYIVEQLEAFGTGREDVLMPCICIVTVIINDLKRSSRPSSVKTALQTQVNSLHSQGTISEPQCPTYYYCLLRTN